MRQTKVNGGYSTNWKLRNDIKFNWDTIGLVMFLTTLVIVCSITTESFFERIIIYSVTDVFV